MAREFQVGQTVTFRRHSPPYIAALRGGTVMRTGLTMREFMDWRGQDVNETKLRSVAGNDAKDLDHPVVAVKVGRGLLARIWPVCPEWIEGGER